MCVGFEPIADDSRPPHARAMPKKREHAEELIFWLVN